MAFLPNESVFHRLKKKFTIPIKQLLGSLFERVQGGKKIPETIRITRTQLPIVPAFAITTYKAQGLTMNKIIVDLHVPLGTMQVASIYVPLNRVKRAEDVTILRPFDIKALQIEGHSRSVLCLLLEIV
jgi:ATP-dependent exoDNAse (exonuclease V) alpha subunit